ncbi:MAG TPA: RDD family protein [Acidimicrobiales bacterium]
MTVSAHTRLVPASLTQRAIGRAIDLAVLVLLMGLAFMPFSEGDEVDVPPLFLAAVLLAVLAYEVVPVRLTGQTPGKVIARTRVVDARDGALPSVRASLIRWGVVCAVWVALSMLGLPQLAIVVLAALYLSALADPSGRNVLDKAAGTRVVRSNVPAAADESPTRSA